MIDERIRQILNEYGRLAVDCSTIDASTDLHAAGLTSHATVSLMLAIEDAFYIEFPEALLTRSTFASIASIAQTIQDIRDHDTVMD